MNYKQTHPNPQIRSYIFRLPPPPSIPQPPAPSTLTYSTRQSPNIRTIQGHTGSPPCRYVTPSPFQAQFLSHTAAATLFRPPTKPRIVTLSKHSLSSTTNLLPPRARSQVSRRFNQSTKQASQFRSYRRRPYAGIQHRGGIRPRPFYANSLDSSHTGEPNSRNQPLQRSDSMLKDLNTPITQHALPSRKIVHHIQPRRTCKRRARSSGSLSAPSLGTSNHCVEATDRLEA